MGYLNFLLSLPEEWIIATLEKSPGEPSIERDSLSSPMTAWALDHIEFTGNPADMIQCGSNKTQDKQLFGNYFAHCMDANISHSRTHTSFSNEFEGLFTRLTTSFQTGGLTFDKIRPGNAIHYRGIRFKETPDDTSRMDVFKDQVYPSIDSPVQRELARQLEINAPDDVSVAVEHSESAEEVPESVDDTLVNPCEIPEPPLVDGWCAAVGEDVGVQISVESNRWVKGSIVGIPIESKYSSERIDSFKVMVLDETFYIHRDQYHQVRPLASSNTSREVVA